MKEREVLLENCLFNIAFWLSVFVQLFYFACKKLSVVNKNTELASEPQLLGQKFLLNWLLVMRAHLSALYTDTFARVSLVADSIWAG